MATIDRRGLIVGEDTPSVGSSDPSANLAIKTPVRVATTANITLNGLQTIDGVAVVADDRVLVKNQTAPTENGIYLASTGNWTRTTDFDSVREAVKGTIVFVNEGTVGVRTAWMVVASDPITPDTTSLTFASLDDHSGASARGAVRMWQSVGERWEMPANYPWNVVDPYGVTVSTAGSTTMGFNEAAEYAYNYGHNLDVTGGASAAIADRDTGNIWCTTIPVLKPMRHGYTKIVAGMTIADTVTDPLGFVIGSLQEHDLEILGEVVRAGDGAVITFRPTDGTPVDPVQAIGASRVYINAAVSLGAGTENVGVLFNTDTAPIGGLKLTLGEVNGGKHGLLVQNPVGGNYFANNDIEMYLGHLQTGISVLIGTGSTSQIHGNTFRLHISPVAGAPAFKTFARGDLYLLSIDSISGAEPGLASTGIELGTGAANNIIICPRCDATVPYVNNSGNDTNTVFVNGEWYGPPATALALKANIANPAFTGTIAASGPFGAWSTYVPTFGASGGGIAPTVTVNSARYWTIGKTTFVAVKFTITNINGNTGQNVVMSLPNTAAGEIALPFFESGVSGNIGIGIPNGSTAVTLNFYSSALTPTSTLNYVHHICGSYENT